MALRMRHEQRNYMNTASGGSAVWSLINEGFTDFSESKNSVEYTRTYVADNIERSDVTGYAPATSYSCDVYDDDPVVKKIVAITDGELMGDATAVSIVQFNTFDETAPNSKIFKAVRRRWTVIPDGKAGGAGTDALIYTGTLKAGGAMVSGTFDEAGKTFTEV